MKPQIVFFTEFCPSLIINLAQLVSPSVALPAELVLEVYLRPLHLTILDKTILDLDYLRQLSWNFIDLDLDIKIELLPPPPSVKSL